MLNISRDIHSISDFKRNTPEFVRQLKETGKPVVLTMNGRAEVVIQDARSYQDMLEILDRVKDIEAVREAITDAEQGSAISLDAFDKEMKSKHSVLNKR